MSRTFALPAGVQLLPGPPSLHPTASPASFRSHHHRHRLPAHPRSHPNPPLLPGSSSRTFLHHHTRTAPLAAAVTPPAGSLSAHVFAAPAPGRADATAGATTTSRQHAAPAAAPTGPAVHLLSYSSDSSNTSSCTADGNTGGCSTVTGSCGSSLRRSQRGCGPAGGWAGVACWLGSGVAARRAAAGAGGAGLSAAAGTGGGGRVVQGRGRRGATAARTRPLHAAKSSGAGSTAGGGSGGGTAAPDLLSGLYGTPQVGSLVVFSKNERSVLGRVAAADGKKNWFVEDQAGRRTSVAPKQLQLVLSA
ncbi:hypothetical protein Agub_g8461, partial [Astrephomene gubernaculifera]